MDALSIKRNIDDDYNNDKKVKNTKTICISIIKRPKEHPQELSEGKKPLIRRCRQQYARQRTREEGSALEKRIEVDKVDLEI